MNDNQVIEELSQTDLYAPGTLMPVSAWSRETALAEIERRMGMDTKDGTNRKATPPGVTRQIEPSATPKATERLTKNKGKRGWSGALVGGVAFAVVVIVGVAILLASLGGDVVTPSATTTVALQPLQPGPVTSFEDIAGTTYQRQGPGGVWYLQFFEDGTLHDSANRGLVEDRPERLYETRFEGTKILITTHSSMCPQPDQGGTYEIHVLESSNLEFVLIEDTCGGRSGVFQAEWAPVP